MELNADIHLQHNLMVIQISRFILTVQRNTREILHLINTIMWQFMLVIMTQHKIWKSLTSSTVYTNIARKSGDERQFAGFNLFL